MVQLTDVTQRYAEAAGCDALYEVREPSVGLHGFIAMHDLSRGPGYGGIRRRRFASASAAVREVVGLAEGMTLKTAFAGLPAGGAKGVLLDPPGPCELGPLYFALGRAIEELGGTFFAGPDVGTSEVELATLRQATRWVSQADAVPWRSTAKGVVAGCRAALEHLGLLSASGLTAPVRAAIIGVGSVGAEVARRLAALGIQLTVSDIDEAKVRAVADALGATVAGAHELPPADLLVPCALGPVVTGDNLGQLRYRVICGAANHQLERSTLAPELAAQEVLYVPDFTVNAGGVIGGVLARIAAPGEDVEASVEAALDAIGPRVRAMLALAVEAEVTPLEAALMMIDQADEARRK